LRLPFAIYQSPGKRISLHRAAVQFTEAASTLKGHSPAAAVDGFLGSVVTVKRISLREAIEQFIAFRKGKTLAAEGRRPHWQQRGNVDGLAGRLRFAAGALREGANH
jgi:hypothetical protein